MRKIFLILCLQSFAAGLNAQPPLGTPADTSVFARITQSVKLYRFDTTAVPDDKITRAILELRRLRGGFNINEAILYKLEEEFVKGNLTVEEAAKQRLHFTQGAGKRWLDNATVWIYRNHFTYNQLKGLVKFYKSEAGQQMADAFPVIMVQTLMAAEKVKAMSNQ